jgi:hypothetical protein
MLVKSFIFQTPREIFLSKLDLFIDEEKFFVTIKWSSLQKAGIDFLNRRYTGLTPGANPIKLF